MKKSVLSIAEKTVQSRAKSYNTPLENMQHIADVCNALLKTNFTAKDIAVIMLVVKLCREQYKHKRDNVIDSIGYLYVYDECFKRK